MKIAIMQPYFFPYLGYFQLMSAVDEWVVFDDIQYIRHGWINRNRILSPNLEKEWQYITVPLKKYSQNSLINQIEIRNTNSWVDSILGGLSYYKRIKAPYYNDTIAFIKPLIDSEYKFISKLNIDLIQNIASLLDIEINITISSKKDFKYKENMESDDWALEISKKMGASTYINPIGGSEIFNKNKFINESIQIKFLKPNLVRYKQSRREYVSMLSIIDSLMFNSLKEVKEMLNNYEII